jgi:uncharacterized membrane protein
MNDLALLLHVLAVLVFFAGVVAAGLAFEVARRREDARDIAVVLRVARIGALLVAVGGLLTPVFGAWLVHLDGLSWGTGWISWALALYVLAMLLGGFGGRRPRHARELAERLSEQGAPVSGELRALLDDRVSRLANYASLGLVLAILWLMIYKP